MKFKRTLSVIMCFAMLLTAVPLTAFAKDEAYVKIKFRDTKNQSILLGETEEVYIECSTGGLSDYEIVWEMSNEKLGKIESATDEPSWHVTRVNITGTTLGYFTLTVKIVDSDGNVIASDETLVWTVEPDNRTFGKKIEDFFMRAGFTSWFTFMFIILPIISTPVTLPINIYHFIRNRFFG
ncbi:MAG: hypothetical protein IJO36_03660 [Clostridia bacterium]|nr:hypothetical protein [Clostridia bacterium]